MTIFISDAKQSHEDSNFKLSWYNFEEKNAIYDLSAIILCSWTQKNFPVSNSYFLLWIYTCLNLSYFHYILGNKIVARENYKNGEKDMAERQRLKELSQGNSDQSGLSREERDRRATVWITTRQTSSEEKKITKTDWSTRMCHTYSVCIST